MDLNIRRIFVVFINNLRSVVALDNFRIFLFGEFRTIVVLLFVGKVRTIIVVLYSDSCPERYWKDRCCFGVVIKYKKTLVVLENF